MTDEDQLLDDLYDLIVGGDAQRATAAVKQGLERSLAPNVMLFDAMIPALEEVGRRFEAGEYFLPEMLIAARSMQTAMDLLRPYIVDAAVAPLGTFLIGTVAGDIHDVGKNLCSVMLEGAGFRVVDLGVNVSGQQFVDAIRSHQPAVVGMSAFLTTTMMEIESNLHLFESAGMREDVVVMIGGAPINDEFARAVGADGYAPDASAAVRTAKQLISL